MIKKPDITEGEWRIAKLEDTHYKWLVNAHGLHAPYEVVKCNKKGNAQVISAVPEMIDALIESIDHLDKTTSGGRMRRNIYKVLEKAGCKFE